MNKAQLLSEMATFYKDVGAPQYIDASKDTNWYIVKVMDAGLSGKNKKPTAFIKTVTFYVYKEGTIDEVANYGEKEPENSANYDVTADGSLSSVSKIYKAPFMRSRVQAATAKAAQDILDESLYSANLASNASSGQKNVVVSNGTGVNFWIGKIVNISDTSASEQNTIASISGDTLTMVTNLSNTYTTAHLAKITYKDNKERLKWAGNALLDPNNYLDAMTNYVSLNTVVQAAGGQVTDNDINYIVSTNINALAVAIDP